MNAFFGGIAWFFLLVLGLGLIFEAGAVIGCATLVLIAFLWAIVRVKEAERR